MGYCLLGATVKWWLLVTNEFSFNYIYFHWQIPLSVRPALSQLHNQLLWSLSTHAFLLVAVPVAATWALVIRHRLRLSNMVQQSLRPTFVVSRGELGGRSDYWGFQNIVRLLSPFILDNGLPASTKHTMRFLFYLIIIKMSVRRLTIRNMEQIKKDGVYY